METESEDKEELSAAWLMLNECVNRNTVFLKTWRINGSSHLINPIISWLLGYMQNRLQWTQMTKNVDFVELVKINH